MLPKTRCVRYGGRHVHSAHPNSADRGRKALLLSSPGARRTPRQHRAPAHPPQPRSPLRYSPGGLAAAVRPHQRCVERSGAAGGRLPAWRGRGSATDRGAVDRPRRGRADRRTDRCAADRCRLVAAGPPPQRRRGAGRPVGARATGPAGAADPVGRQRRPAQRGHRRHRRASGRARLGARDAPLAAGAQRSRGVARRRLRDRRCDAALPRLGRAGEASRGDRGASVRPRDGAVRPAADGDALRPDQYLLRGRGERPAAGATRALEGEAQRLPAADPGPDARCQRLRAPLEGLRRQRPGTPDAGRDARSTAGRRPAPWW